MRSEPSLKCVVEISPEGVVKLAEMGLIKGAQVIGRNGPDRRAMSRSVERQIEACVDELRKCRRSDGSFDVSRTGDRAVLGKWWDKLKETYLTKPDAARIEWLKNHAPDLLVELEKWKRARVPRGGKRNQPFWLSAAWVFEWMLTTCQAPSQASVDPHEIAMAKWLSRWTAGGAVAALPSGAHREVAGELDMLAVALRSRRMEVRNKAVVELRKGYRHRLYAGLAELCKQDRRWARPDQVLMCREKIDRQLSFWPSRAEWNAMTQALEVQT